jgi:hypothetical protein
MVISEKAFFEQKAQPRVKKTAKGLGFAFCVP